MKRFWVIVCMLAVMLPAGAQLIKQKTELPKWYEDQLHKSEHSKYLLIAGNAISADIDKLFASPEAYWLAVLQCPPEALKENDVQRLLAWVNDGGVLWFNDSRLGPAFGFENAPIDGSEFPKNGFKADFKPYGGHKVEGASMLSAANRPATHPVLSGVDPVQMWVLRVGNGASNDPKQPGLYSAVKATPNVVPLLRYNPVTNGPLHDNLAAALREVGNGAIVFKPLVWEEQQTGGRFQYNLLEWSLGFGVPDPTASGPSGRKSRRRAPSTTTGTNGAANASVDQVTFLDKHVLSGTVTSREIKIVQFEPVVSSTNLPMAQVKSIVLQVDGAHDVVMTRDGRRLTGSVSFPDDLAVRNPSGQTQKIKKSEILRVILHDAPSAPPDKKGN